MAQAVSNTVNQNVRKSLFTPAKPTVNFNPISQSAKNALSGYKLDYKGGLMAPKAPSTAQPQTQAVQTNTTQQQSHPNISQTLNDLQRQAQGLQSSLNQSVASGQIQSGSPVKGLLTPPKAPTPPTPPQYSSIVGDIQGASTPSGTQTGLVSDLRGAGQGNLQIGQDAREIAKRYGDEIARVGGLGAGAVAGNLSTGSNVVGSGNAAIASQSASARMNALAQGLSSELMGTGQQLTAQNQLAGAYGQALGGANTQQAQTLAGLGTAGSLAQPVQVAPGSSLYSPFGGSSIAGGLGGYADYRTAEQVMGLIDQYPDAGYSYDQNLTPQQNLAMAQQAIQASPTYQKSTFGVPGQSTIAGAQQVQTAQQGYNQAFQNYQNLQAQFNNADMLAENLVNVMTEGGINPLGVQAVDKKWKDVIKQFSDEDQQAFDTALREVQSAYSNLLITGGGTIPSSATEAADVILNPNSTVGAIMAAIKQLKLAGETRLATQGDQVNTYYSQLQGGGGMGGGTQQQMNQGGGSVFAEQW